jgi:hypothetical protein
MSSKTNKETKKTADEDGKCYTSTWAIVCYVLIGIFFLLALGLLIFGKSKTAPVSSIELSSVTSSA